MPTSRTVMLLIKAQNATGEALKAVQGDMNKVADTAGKMGEKTEKGFMQGIRGAMSFVRQIRGIYFIIAGIVAGLIFKLAEPVNEYTRALNKMQGAANLTAEDVKKLGEIFKEQGIGIGLGTLALMNGTRSASEASSAFVDILGSLRSALSGMMPPMEKQDEILKRIGVSYEQLYAVMSNKDPLTFWDLFHDKVLSAKDMIGLFANRNIEAGEILGKTREELVKQNEAMADAARKTQEADERMRAYNQAVKDASAAWMDFQATIGPGLLKIKTAIISFFPDLVKAMNKLPQAFGAAPPIPQIPQEFVGPPAPAPAIPGILSPLEREKAIAALPPEPPIEISLEKIEAFAQLKKQGDEETLKALDEMVRIEQDKSEGEEKFALTVTDGFGKITQYSIDTRNQLNTMIGQIYRHIESLNAKLTAQTGNL